jgi:hypothetical protein
MNRTHHPSFFVGRHTELGLILAILAAFILLCFWATLKAIPVWLDEITVADPAINFVLGNGFVSTGWQYQNRTEFWASNAPLHQAILIFWLKIWSITPFSTRSINFFYAAFTAFFIWNGSKRLNLIPSEFVRIALVLCILGAAGTSINYLSGRYDFIGILLLSICFWICTLQESKTKWALLVAVSILLPIAGVNLLPYVALSLFIFYLFLDRPTVRKIGVSMILGIFIGIAILFTIYFFNGVASRMVESAGGHGFAGAVQSVETGITNASASEKAIWAIQNIGSIAVNRISNAPIWYTHNYSYLVLLGLLIILSFHPKSRSYKKHLGVAWGFAVLTPLVMGGLRDYPFYYSWMAIIPMSIILFSLIPLCLRSYQKLITTAAVFLVAYPGMIGHVVTASSRAERQADYTKSFQALSEEAKPSDKIYADFSAYYPLVQKADYVLLPTYKDMLTPQDVAEVNMLVVEESNFPLASSLFPGPWVKIRTIQAHTPYNLSVYRKPDQAAF